METKSTRKTKRRGALPKRKSTPVSVPIPKTWLDPIDQAIAILDTDRSKLVRKALEEKLARLGINVPTLAA